jgi:hypothetical protein
MTLTRRPTSSAAIWGSFSNWLRPAVFDRNVLALEEALFAQTFAQRRDHRGICPPEAEEGDHEQRPLLRVRRKRAGRCAAERSDEVAPSKANAHLALLCLPGKKIARPSL